MTNHKPIIVEVGGSAQHGKDTFASLVKQYAEENGKRCVITHYADYLKFVAKQFWGWDGKKDEKGRTLLQQVGTEKIRFFDENFWVESVERILPFLDADIVLIADCRFVNEVEYFRKMGYTTIYVKVIRENFDNGLTPEQKRHPSETALNNYEPDCTAYNSSSLENLLEVAEVFYDCWLR